MRREAKHLSKQQTDFRSALLRWYRRAGRHDLPWRTTRDPYAILVSEFMLQQTQVATVLPYYKRWLQRFPDFASVAAASENDILHAWQGLGYYSRARHLQAAARLVVRQWRGRLPKNADEIATLPGVGRYTANAIATFAFDRSLPIVEANIGRVLARLHNFQTPIDTAAGRDALWEFASQLLPARSARMHNSALMDLGAMVCTARAPQCAICPVREFCAAENPESLPAKKPRQRSVRLIEQHGFHFLRSRVLLEKASQRWRGMWILPPLASPPRDQTPLHVATFPFTHHQINLEVFAAPPPRTNGAERCWFSSNALEKIPMPSPHRRALISLLAAPQNLCSDFATA